MQLVLQEITSQLLAGDVFLSNEAYIEFKEDYLALIITAVDIVNGAAYLFQKIPSSDNHHWKADLKIEQFRKVLESDKKSGCENQENGI
jgi:hypothetical protein